jgi:hypothetical protein
MFRFHCDEVVLPKQEKIYFRKRTSSIDPAQHLLQSCKFLAHHTESPEIGDELILTEFYFRCTPKWKNADQPRQGNCRSCQGVDAVPKESVFRSWTFKIVEDTRRESRKNGFVITKQNPRTRFSLGIQRFLIQNLTSTEPWKNSIREIRIVCHKLFQSLISQDSKDQWIINEGHLYKLIMMQGKPLHLNRLKEPSKGLGELLHAFTF